MAEQTVFEPLEATEAPRTATGCEIANKYDWNVQIAIAICIAESGGISTQTGDNYVINGLYAPSCGLFQIRTLVGRPTCEQLKDPATNVEWAYKISKQGTDWTPWSVFNNRRYIQFL